MTEIKNNLIKKPKRIKDKEKIKLRKKLRKQLSKENADDKIVSDHEKEQPEIKNNLISESSKDKEPIEEMKKQLSTENADTIISDVDKELSEIKNNLINKPKGIKDKEKIKLRKKLRKPLTTENADDKIISEQDQEKLLENIPCPTVKDSLKEVISSKNDCGKLDIIDKIMNTEKYGYNDDPMLTQDEILKNSPFIVQQYRIDKKDMKYGPYCFDFTRNGVGIATGGYLGAFNTLENWMTRKSGIDINVKRSILAVKYLHKEEFIATAETDFVYVYDKYGKEIHCVKKINNPIFLEYLPYHYQLAVGCNDMKLNNSFLKYLDVAVGKLTTEFYMGLGMISTMTQNPSNALIATAHRRGSINFWTPTNGKKPVMKMFVQSGRIGSIAIDRTGNYLATSGFDGRVRLWDLRNTQEQLSNLLFKSSPQNLAFSQRGMLAFNLEREIVVFNDLEKFNGEATLPNGHRKTINKPQPYLSHEVYDKVAQLQFCPYQDILGVGLHKGFQTMLVPGAGEANFDAFDDNPFATKETRKEKEIKDLMNRIPVDMIGIDNAVNEIHLESVEEEWMRERRKAMGEEEQIEIKKKKSKALKPKSATAKTQQVKDNLYIERIKQQKKLMDVDVTNYKVKQPYERGTTHSVLDNLRNKRI